MTLSQSASTGPISTQGTRNAARPYPPAFQSRSFYSVGFLLGARSADRAEAFRGSWRLALLRYYGGHDFPPRISHHSDSPADMTYRALGAVRLDGSAPGSMLHLRTSACDSNPGLAVPDMCRVPLHYRRSAYRYKPRFDSYCRVFLVVVLHGRLCVWRRLRGGN